MKPFPARLLLVAALVLFAISSAYAAELEWNQQRVAALAQDLIEPLEALRADLESRPPLPEKEEARVALVNDVERLWARARELAQRLASGAGRDETVGLFRDVEALQSRATHHSLMYPAPFDMHVHIDRAKATIIQLTRYYGASPDSDAGLQRYAYRAS
jgi:hypothetical protein